MINLGYGMFSDTSSQYFIAGRATTTSSTKRPISYLNISADQGSHSLFGSKMSLQN